MAVDPNIILQAGRGTPTTDLATLLQQRSQIRLSQLAATRQSQTQDALDRVRADPSDMTSLADLAALDPQAANGYLGVQAAARAGRARTATANLYRSAVPDAQPAVPGAAPDAGSPAPPAAQPPVSGAPNQGAQASVDPFDHKGPAEQIVGSNVTSGKMTMQEAAAQLADVADPAQVQQVLGTLKSMDDLQFERVSRTNKMMADTLASIKTSVPVDPNNPSQPARHAALMQNAPQLAGLGITPQQLAQIDLSDQGINGVVGKAMGYQGLIDQAQKDRQFGLEAQKQNLDERKQAFEEHKPVAAGFGVTLVDPTTHQAVFDGSGGAASGGQFTGGWTPRARNGGDNSDAAVDAKISGAAQMLGVKPGDDISKLDPMTIARAMTVGEGGQGTLADRNNNPANLRNADGSYKKFASRAAGLQAAADLVSSKLRNGQTTVQTMIEGVPQQGVIRAAAGLSAQALTDASDLMIKNGGKAPEGFARNAAQQAALRNAYSIRKAQLGMSTDQIVQEGQDTASQANALKLWNSGRPGTGAAVSRSISVSIDHLDQAAKAAQALQNGNTPLFNSVANLISKETGKAPVTNFGAVKDFVTDEVTKAILAGNGGVGDRDKASKILASWNSPAQTSGVMDQLHGLMAGQLHGLAMQHKQTTGRDDFGRYISPRAQAVLSSYVAGGGLPVLSVEQARAAPSGTRFQTVDGRTMVKK